MALRSRRFAIVIGNGAYSGELKLDSSVLDATQMGASLRKLDFDVTLGCDLGFEAMNAKIAEFISKLQAASADTTLFYFSGHGLQIRGQNYAVPIDFDREDGGRSVKLINVQSVVDRLSEVSTTRVILLDACRNGDEEDDKREYENRFSDHLTNKSVGSSGDASRILTFGEIKSNFVEMAGADNTFIAFATGSGKVAYPGKGKSLSPFTAGFTKYMESVDLPLSNLTSRVRIEVLRLTNNRQNTWDQSSLRAPFFFNPGSLLLMAGNAMALLGLFLALVPYSFLLAAGAPWPWIAIAAILPLISLGIMLFGMQSAYSRLRGSLDPDLDRQLTLIDHFNISLQKGTIGAYLGSLLASLGIGIPYYLSWAKYDVNEPGRYDKLEPLGAVLLEITIATVLTACILGFLSLFFARATWRPWRFALSSHRSSLRTIIGAIFGGMLAGLIAGPLLTGYFGVKSRPDMDPILLIPGAIFGAGFLIFSIVNFDFERLTLSRIRSSGLAALAAIFIGATVGLAVMGFFDVIGMVRWVTEWLHKNALDYRVLAVGGAIYAIPVGAILAACRA